MRTYKELVSQIWDIMSESEFGKEDNFYFYKEPTSSMWRWRRIALNGNIVGASTEGYVNFTDCTKNAIRNGLTKNHNILE